MAMISELSSPPLVSIVIPAYNCRHFIALTIRSIQAQTFREWECVMVDDGSTDDTLQLIREMAAADSRLRVASQSHGGPSAARNHGLAMTDRRSQYISFMDSDDLWLPDALEVLKTEMEKHPEAIGAHARGGCIDQAGAEYADPSYAANGNGRFWCDLFGRIVTLDASTPTSFRSLWYSNPYPPGLILTKRSAYEKAGSFDAGVCPVEDWDMILRLSRQGGFRFVEKVILSYRRHDNNLSAQSALVVGQQIRNLLRKTFFSEDNDLSQRKIVRDNFRASEMLHLRQQLAAAKEHAASGNIRDALLRPASACLHLLRFLKGAPRSVPVKNIAPPPAEAPLFHHS
jgi:glycosyltransferase involved in cell wall biosynthesis